MPPAATRQLDESLRSVPLPTPPESDLLIRPMRRDELAQLIDWAAEEGWNPGVDDVELFWETDPEAFIAAELGGDLVGGGSIVRYGRHFGFMGLFIVRRDQRGHGLGDRLWNERKRRLLARLEEPKTVGMDGVFAMQDFYAEGGFRVFSRSFRFAGTAAGRTAPGGTVELSTLPLEEIDAYDRRHFPAPRTDFLARWIAQERGHAVGVRRDGRLRGFGVLRRCRTGCKIGPLFADDPATAELLFVDLTRRVPAECVFLDVPENNPAGLALARSHGMVESFGCARMYLGPPPQLPAHEIFGITTFELG